MVRCVDAAAKQKERRVFRRGEEKKKGFLCLCNLSSDSNRSTSVLSSSFFSFIFYYTLKKKKYFFPFKLFPFLFRHKDLTPLVLVITVIFPIQNKLVIFWIDTNLKYIFDQEKKS